MLALLAAMLAGAVMAATASAEPGPFWHHRAIGGEGDGAKIEPGKPENFSGEGGKQTLKGFLLAESTPIEITSEGSQVKGAIFNNASQGQIKLEVVYKQPKLVIPPGTTCVVAVGNNNVVQVKGHLMWKWDGTTAQLTEQPQLKQKWDIGFTAVEPQQGETELKRGAFTVVTLSGTGCLLSGSHAVEGSEVGIPDLSQLKTWSRSLEVRTVEHSQAKAKQHFWDGTEFQGTHLGLTFTGFPASYIGQTKVKAEQQEIAVFEK
jgi:hypothetical protein